MASISGRHACRGLDDYRITESCTSATESEGDNEVLELVVLKTGKIKNTYLSGEDTSFCVDFRNDSMLRRGNLYVVFAAENKIITMEIRPGKEYALPEMCIGTNFYVRIKNVYPGGESTTEMLPIKTLGAAVSSAEIKSAVEAYLERNPVSGTTTEEKEKINIIKKDGNGTKFLSDNGEYKKPQYDGLNENEINALIEKYITSNKVGQVSTEEIKQAVSTYLAENPPEGGNVSEEIVNSIVEKYLASNPITSIDEDAFNDMAGEFMEDNTIWGSSLPIIFLEGDTTGMSKENAVDITAHFVSQFKDFADTATLKWQGTSSIAFPKKNFTIKFTNKHGFGWGKQKKYCLKANYIDHSHARNIVSAKIWSQIVSSRSDYEELDELFKNSPNNGAVDGFPIRLYLNGEYQGLYTLNVPKGSWQFNMNDTNENHCILCGENYVSGCFRGSALIDGTDWSDELHDIVPDSVKTRWNEAIDFVMNSTDEDFKNGIDNYIDLQSLIDYYIYAYVSTGLDSMGKNQIYYTYNGQKYYASMYDMDSTWGMYYNGQKFVSTTYRMQEDYESKVNNRQGNLLYERLKTIFKDEIQTRYNELRENILSYSNILGKFESFMSCITTEQYAEDLTIYAGIPSGTTNNIKQLRSYVKERLSYVDGMIKTIQITSMAATASNCTVGSSVSVNVAVVPSNANNYTFKYKSDNDEIATVSETGIVTGKSPGKATITVTDTISNLTCTCDVIISEAGELTGTVFYGTKIGGIDIYNNGTLYYVGDRSLNYDKFIGFCSYYGSNTLYSGSQAGTHVLLVSADEIKVNSNRIIIPASSNYEAYCARVSNNSSTPGEFVTADAVFSDITITQEGTAVTVKEVISNNKADIKYANADIYTMDGNITFTKNYNQADYE